MKKTNGKQISVMLLAVILTVTIIINLLLVKWIGIFINTENKTVTGYFITIISIMIVILSDIIVLNISKKRIYETKERSEYYQAQTCLGHSHMPIEKEKKR